VEPGQLHNIHAIAANGKGDVFVTDVSGIQVFDGSGRFLRRIEMEDWAMGMAFNNAGYALRHHREERDQVRFPLMNAARASLMACVRINIVGSEFEIDKVVFVFTPF